MNRATFPTGRRSIPLALLCCWLLVSAIPASQQAPARQPGHTISGRVLDPARLNPEAATLMLGTLGPDGTVSSIPVPTQADGRFVTRPVHPGTYTLEVVRTPHSHTSPATVVGFRLVSVADTEVADVNVEIRRDTAMSGRFVMESDDPAPWPTSIVVNAFLALDGMALVGGTVAEGRPEGRFVLHNAFGPCVVRCGYTLAPGTPWWPTRVLLDGVDITDVPTDFSTHQNATLEVVFTRHPARFAGTVRDAQGRPAAGAWIVAFAADEARRQEWSQMSKAQQADGKGAFRFQALPGRYLVRALPSTALSRPSNGGVAHVTAQQMTDFAPGALAVDLAEREQKTLRLAIAVRGQ